MIKNALEAKRKLIEDNLRVIGIPNMYDSKGRCGGWPGCLTKTCGGVTLANGKIHGLSSVQLKHICQIDAEGPVQMITIRATVEVRDLRATFDARYVYIYTYIFIYV